MSGSAQQWEFYGGDPAGTCPSPLDQINTTNVKKLRVAWTYDTGDFSDGGDNTQRRIAIQTNVRGPDLGTFVELAQGKVTARLSCPPVMRSNGWPV